jgi:hypothetical protein
VQPSFAEIEAESGMQISNLGIRVPAPMSEDVNGGESPHDRAWTVRTDRIRVPAPRLELESIDIKSTLFDVMSSWFLQKYSCPKESRHFAISHGLFSLPMSLEESMDFANRVGMKPFRLEVMRQRKESPFVAVPLYLQLY